MHLERARPDDIPAVEHLLAASGLPLDGAAEAFRAGLLAWNGEALVAVAAIEPYGSAGLLRSVAVVPELRGTGVGAAMVGATEQLAAELGIAELYVLTDMAEAWFARRGYEVVARASVPDDVRTSVEFTTACSDSAVAMRKRRPGS
jgi:amino-acid N-acetyltransferase